MHYAIPIIGLMIIVFIIECLGFQGKQLFLPDSDKGITEAEYGTAIIEPQITTDGSTINQKIYQIPVDQNYTNKIAVYLSGNSSYSLYTIQYREKGNESFSNEISSYCNMASGRDHTKIGAQVESIVLKINEQVTLEKVVLDNTIRLNGNRMLWMFCIGLTVYLLYELRKIIATRLEIGFLIVALAAGMTWTIALPTNTMLTWDDQIHYRNAYQLSYMSNEFQASRSEHELEYLGWAYHNSNTLEDEIDQIKVIDQRNLQKADASSYFVPTLNSIGYATQALGIGMGRALGLSFHIQFLLGKLGNILLYILICYWAIKKAVRYKAIICAIALLPTAFQIACGYSYDPTVNAFILLGCSMFISEMMMPNRRLEWKNAALMLAAFCIGSFPKAIYVPLVLLLLLLPSSKFADRKSKIYFKAGIIGVFIVLMSSFVVPALLATPGTGDLRGGQNVSMIDQLSYVLHNPLTYAKILIKTVVGSSLSLFSAAIYTIPYMQSLVTDGGLSSLIPALMMISMISLLYVSFTDCRKEGTTQELKTGIRWWIFVAIAVVICLIWTSMYLAFTPVGEGIINGVQGRYFIPLIFLGAVLLNPRKVESKTDPMKYNLMVLGCNALVLFSIVGVYLIGSVWL